MIYGLRERMEFAIRQSGKSKIQIAKECHCDRKVFDFSHNHDVKLSIFVRFCVATNSDANWLLGLERDYKKLKVDRKM